MANAYMTKLNKARKSGAASFTHNGNTYVKSKTKKPSSMQGEGN